MDKVNWLKGNICMLIGVILFILFFGLLGTETYNQIKTTKQACKDIGMEYQYYDDKTFCVDEYGNAEFVIFECEGILWNKECEANILTIGDLRIKEGKD